MGRRILAVLAFSVAVGLVTGLAAGRLPGAGAFAFVAVIGSFVVVLRRNHLDRMELERRLEHTSAGGALGDEPLGRRAP
jgi:hypothetical protein